MFQSILGGMVKIRIFGKSPVAAYLRLNAWAWRHLSPSFTNLSAMRSYGRFLHALVCLSSIRRQNSSTYFFRNRAELELIRRLSDQRSKGDTLKISVLGCSNGAELYSILWTLHLARPDLKIIARAVDISESVLELAKKGVYSSTTPELVEGRFEINIFERISGEEMQGMFDQEGAQAKIKTWLKEGIIWHVGDAGDPGILNVLGAQDIVVGNRFLCHMNAADAENCLRNIARLVMPGGHLFVSGIDLDIRARLASNLNWKPVMDLIEDIHDGDPSLRDRWPWGYWTMEPFDKRRPDWKARYASAFQLGFNWLIFGSFLYK